MSTTQSRGGTAASERCDRRRLKLSDHRGDRGVQSKTSTSQSSQEVDEVESIQQELLSETSHPSLHATINSRSNTSDRVEVLLWQDCIVLAVVANGQDGGECIRELKDAGGTDEGDEVADLRDSCGEDESEGPVNGN